MILRQPSGLLRSGLWLGFFGVILLAWLAMFAMARMSGLDLLGRSIAPNGMPMESYGALAAMWGLMMAAMMGPTLVPTLRAYDDLILSAGATRGGWLGVLAGYFAVWLVFAMGIAGVQTALLRAGLIDGLGMATSATFTGALLLAVGLFQFTRTKEICHGVCHAPTIHFIGHWRPGARGGLRMGATLGAYCAACCWGMMALGFVGGTMSLLWMGAATLFMVLEKLPQIGHRVIRPLGAILILAGLVVLSGILF
ncbi:DUF2182 domain-containing protein [Maribius pontilimi]|uniref:DUF2182 domain-containing protein n=1 Tax=Palleronia pontilimi TaxID=1964209 RepID=A0A934IL35_9RHOB|nr:DUF2182 domain-containing protein [Palleronia pontilimi]MBJ3763994.1 DUF2182 domain-containing protein [Palleronia pontilimi]